MRGIRTTLGVAQNRRVNAKFMWKPMGAPSFSPYLIGFAHALGST
jgi:hypothetical protein